MAGRLDDVVLGRSKYVAVYVVSCVVLTLWCYRTIVVVHIDLNIAHSIYSRLCTHYMDD